MRPLRLVLVPLGVLLAGLTAFAIGLAGALSHGYGAGLAGVAADTGLAMLTGGLSGADLDRLATLADALWWLVVGIPFVPVALVALLGEAFGIGSWMAYVLGTGALFAAMPSLFPDAPLGLALPDPATGGLMPGGWPPGAVTGLAATGFAAGFVYWLVAGQGAPRPHPPRRGWDPAAGQPAAREDAPRRAAGPGDRAAGTP